MNDHVLLRTKDITIIIGMLGIVLYLFNLAQHTTHWDDAVRKQDTLELLINTHTVALAVVNAQYIDIKKDLDEIKKNTR